MKLFTRAQGRGSSEGSIVMRTHTAGGTRGQIRPEVSNALLADVLEAAIRARQPLSRSEIAKELGLTPSTVSKAVTALRNQGYLGEDEEAMQAGRRGRPVIPLRVGGRYRLIGIYVLDSEQPRSGLRNDVCISWLVGVVMRLDGTVEGPAGSRGFTFQELKEPDRADAVAQAIKELVEELSNKLGPGQVVAGVGVALGGHIDKGRVITTYNLAWRQREPIPLQERLQALLSGVIVVVDNDADALATHARWFWRKRGSKGLPDLPGTFIAVLITPSGVGSGLYLDGQRFHGGTGLVGEIGHFKIDRSESARQCRCRQYGCLEAYAGPEEMLEQVHESGVPDLGTLGAAAKSTDDTVREIFERGGAALGTVLSFAINLVGPQAILIFAPRELVEVTEGGAGSHYWTALVEMAHEAAFSSQKKLPIEVLAVPDDRGPFHAETAAAAVLDQLIVRLREDKDPGGASET
jgi:predicted NBD/HSP70 family sugar kinase